MAMIESIHLVWSSCLFILLATAKSWFQYILISIFRLSLSNHVSTTYSERVLISVHRISLTYTFGCNIKHMFKYSLQRIQPAFTQFRITVFTQSRTNLLKHKKSIGPFGRQFDHSIKDLVSIKTSANPSLIFHTLPYPTLLDAPSHPTPTHPTKPYHT